MSAPGAEDSGLILSQVKPITSKFTASLFHAQHKFAFRKLDKSRVPPQKSCTNGNPNKYTETIDNAILHKVKSKS